MYEGNPMLKSIVGDHIYKNLTDFSPHVNPDGTITPRDAMNQTIRKWAITANRLTNRQDPRQYQYVMAELSRILHEQYGVPNDDVGNVLENAGIGFKNTHNNARGEAYPSSQDVLRKVNNHMYYNLPSAELQYLSMPHQAINDLTDFVVNSLPDKNTPFVAGARQIVDDITPYQRTPVFDKV